MGGPEAPPLGDLALAYETVAAESAAQAKSLADHAAHLVVHGILHLLGFDHMSIETAGRMEQREIEILGGMGIADPYEAVRESDPIP
jgi:probable rRNA maturation factor